MNLMQNERFHAGRLSPDRVARLVYTISQTTPLLYPIASFMEAGRREAIANNWLLFDVIADVMGRDFVVDSSKSALRLKLLQQARPSDTYAIVLFRDIRGVSYSHKKLGKDPIAAARGWVRQYNRVWNVVRRMPELNLMCISYERLVADPTSERLRIARFLGIDDVPADFFIDTTKCHIAAGNQMKNQGIVKIRADDAWREGHEPNDLERINDIRQRLAPEWMPYLVRANEADE
jgi:hypothetical protein